MDRHGTGGVREWGMFHRTNEGKFECGGAPDHEAGDVGGHIPKDPQEEAKDDHHDGDSHPQAIKGPVGDGRFGLTLAPIVVHFPAFSAPPNH